MTASKSYEKPQRPWSLAADPSTSAGHFFSYTYNQASYGTWSGTPGLRNPAPTSSHYEYGPFGEVLRSTGPVAKVNPFRFSTKYQDDETDLLYYGYRYYNPSTGRWLSRDPIGEDGGRNLYGILDGDALNFVDVLGLDKEVRPLSAPATKCCTKDMIDQGEKILNARFQRAKAAAKARGIKPAPGGGAGATCKNSSMDIIDWLMAFPPCWSCHIEERNYYSRRDDPKDDRWDHQVIICTAYLPGSVKSKEIIFDWWADENYWFRRDVSGGPPTNFRKEYRYPGKIQNPKYYTNCDGTPGQRGGPPPCGFACSTGS